MFDTMLYNKILVLAGISIIGVSLFADILGIDDEPGFGGFQIVCIIAGVLLTAAGWFLTRGKD